MTRLVHTNVDLDEERHARLHRLSKRTRVPASTLVRQGLDRVLELAEAQQRTIERASARDDKTSR